MISFGLYRPIPTYQAHYFKPPSKVPSIMQTNSCNQSIFYEDNICQIQDLGNDEEYQSERRVVCSTKLSRPSAFARVQGAPTVPKEKAWGPLCSQIQRVPEKVLIRQALNSETDEIRSHIIEFRKRRVGVHPAEKSFIDRFKLDDPDYQIDNGKLLKTDQLAKNVLRWMTRHDKRLIQEHYASKRGKQIDVEAHFQNINDYFSSQYNIEDFSNFDRDIVCTLFAPLKMREQRLMKDSTSDESSPIQGKKKPRLVKDRLELFSGDVERTAQFFKHDPGRTIYFSSFKHVFRIYINTLLEMNQKKRSKGFEKFLTQVIGA